MNKPLLPMLSPMKSADATGYDQQRKSQETRSLIELGLFFVPLILVFVGSAIYNYFTRLPFDSTQWKSPRQRTTREQMSDDLVNSNRLLGLNYSQVVSLLGKPDKYHLENWELGYLIRYQLTAPMMLVLDFDEHKRVEKVQVRTFPPPSSD